MPETFVSSIDEIKENIQTFTAYRLSTDHVEKEFYIKRAINGIRFVMFYSSGVASFAPARFLGYAKNDTRKHDEAAARTGMDTNKAITRLLGEPALDGYCEKLYQSFCKSIGLAPKKTGAIGSERRYWSLLADSDLLLDDIARVNLSDETPETLKRGLVDARMGTGDFRRAVAALWGACAVTGCSNHVVLRVSAIKPWRHAIDAERLDPHNALLLIPNLAVAFETGLISFDPDGAMLLSARLTAEDRAALGITDTLRLTLTAQQAHYMGHHRARVFRA
ncbi:MAG TPA: HNH endonuclease signature motif containing protein [Patescibacteria group bacterium]|nr:HNH endonuclease signature motif containing protein [Patescibacteria group bacterium]